MAREWVRFREFWQEGSTRLPTVGVTSSSSASAEYSEVKATDGDVRDGMGRDSWRRHNKMNSACDSSTLASQSGSAGCDGKGPTGSRIPPVGISLGYTVRFSDDRQWPCCHDYLQLQNRWPSCYKLPPIVMAWSPVDIPLGGVGRYMRFQTTGVHDATGYSLGLFELWAEGANAAAASAAAAAGHPPGLAIDGDGQTQWVDSQARNETSITFDVGRSKWFDRVRWRSGNGEVPGAAAAANYTIRVSDDKVWWESVVTRNNSIWRRVW